MSLNASWQLLKEWMQKDKIHVLSALDAIDYYCEYERVPSGIDASEILAEVSSLAKNYSSPRVDAILKNIAGFVNPRPLSKKQREALEILLDGNSRGVVVRGNGLQSRWHSILNKSDRKYCLSIIDWKSSIEETVEELKILPIVQKNLSDLVVSTIDTGGDDIIYVVLQSQKMVELEKIFPKHLKLVASDILA